MQKVYFVPVKSIHYKLFDNLTVDDEKFIISNYVYGTNIYNKCLGNKNLYTKLFLTDEGKYFESFTGEFVDVIDGKDFTNSYLRCNMLLSDVSYYEDFIDKDIPHLFVSKNDISLYSKKLNIEYGKSLDDYQKIRNFIFYMDQCSSSSYRGVVKKLQKNSLKRVKKR